jgi:magnesium-transporting ATPase (P-type)
MIVHEYEEAFKKNGDNVLKQEWKYKLLNTLEFNSTRKRMSVIV